VFHKTASLDDCNAPLFHGGRTRVLGPRLQAGGSVSAAGQTDSILEAPTYILAIIFLVFAVISLSFDWWNRWLRRILLRKRRPGLAASLDKVVAELTVLGFISVLLLLVQPSLVAWCVEVGDRESWTLLSNAPGCECCLEKTAGVSVCAQVRLTSPCMMQLSRQHAVVLFDETSQLTSPLPSPLALPADWARLPVQRHDQGAVLRVRHPGVAAASGRAVPGEASYLTADT